MKEIDTLTITSAQKGRKKAFRALYDWYAPFVWKVIFRTVNGREEVAKQVMQNVFVKVHSVLTSFKFQSNFSTWLYRITYNEAVGYLIKQNREQKRMVPIDDSQRDVPFEGEFSDRDMVSKILGGLSRKDRFLLVAREVNDVPFDELAEITGQSAGALRTQLHRLKLQIKELFNPIEQFS